MKYYGVTTRYYDDGTIKTSIFQIEADSLPESEFAKLKTCDIYQDYFKSLGEAELYKLQAEHA